jgi:hemerythrin-like domain-containing protein
MANNRRSFLATTAALGAAGWATPSFAQPKDKPAEEVGATEDLMREHGVLNRVLLIYKEGLRRLRAREAIDPEVFHRTATLVRKFVEDYHEKLEETFLFPEFEKQKKLLDLVKVLRTQHQAGRAVTDAVLRSATGDQFGKPESRAAMVRAIEAFIRMYRPHEGREDTVLFPTFRKIVSAKRLAELGKQLEKEEDTLFGDEGFEKTVDQVTAIEKQLGIYDLAQLTPK